MERGKRPVAASLIAVATFAAAVPLCWHSLIVAAQWVSDPAFGEEINVAPDLFAVLTGGLGIAGAVRLWNGEKLAARLLIFFWAIAAEFFSQWCYRFVPSVPSVFIGLNDQQDTFVRLWRAAIGKAMCVATNMAIVAALIGIVFLLVRDKKLLEWRGYSESESSDDFETGFSLSLLKRPWQFLRITLIFAIIVVVWQTGDVLSMCAVCLDCVAVYSGNGSSLSPISEMVGHLSETLWAGYPFWISSNGAFLVVAGIAWWRLTERVAVAADGVRHYLSCAQFTVFKKSWNRIVSADLIEHRRRPPHVVFRFRWLGFFPTAYSLPLSRLNRSAELYALLQRTLDEQRVSIRRYFSSERTILIGWLSVVLALVAWIAMNVMQVGADKAFETDQVSIAKFGYQGLPLQQAGLTSLGAVLIGFAFGQFSAFQRAAPRPALFALLLSSSVFFPTPLMYWLMWIAIYTILMATQTPMPEAHFPAMPLHPEWQWSLATWLVALLPAVVGVGYLIGVVTGHRRLPRSPV